MSRHRTVIALATFGLVLALAAPSGAAAQGVDIRRPHTGARPIQLDLHAGFAWWDVGLATGVRLGIPIMNNGFVDSINNAVYINFGVDFYWVRWRGNTGGGWDYGPALGFPVTLHWEFYFHENWSAFLEAGFQIFLHQNFLGGGPFDVYDGRYWFIAGAGASFHISRNFLLTLRVGSPYVALGLTLQF